MMDWAHLVSPESHGILLVLVLELDIERLPFLPKTHNTEGTPLLRASSET
jgi:hypothetical protein